ncbi:MAG: tyrosine-type recombinase/integrase [Candidatus Bipolaricaulis sp.]|nr:tyrosine-type recombinase/integrase [Candidatus Bipolaricaulis sp.]
MKQQRYRTGEKALTRKEYDAVLSVCGTLEDRVMLMLAVSLGLRRGDLVRVRVGNVDFKNHQITYLERKKGDRVRAVPIGQKLEQEIRMLIRTIPKGQDTLFSFKDRQAYNRFNSLCEKAGIGSRPFHTLRASCVKFCQAAGWSPEQVAELTGDTIEVIQAHYATPSQAEMAETMRSKEVC